MIHVERPGPGVLLVGPAQYGRRHFGVPPGGPADPISWRMANRLVGNPEEFPALEVFARSLRLSCDGPHTFAVVGSTVDGIFSRDSLHIEGPLQGRFYVAVRGGFEDPIPNLPDDGDGRYVVEVKGYLRASQWLRVNPGPEGTSEILAQLIQTQFRVSAHSNRMGVRLTGAALPALPEMRSSPTDLGTIQLPPSGEPIILGWDGPTIGGYPRIASVISRDLRNVGQLFPGDTVSFELA